MLPLVKIVSNKSVKRRRSVKAVFILILNHYITGLSRFISFKKINKGSIRFLLERTNKRDINYNILYITTG